MLAILGYRARLLAAHWSRNAAERPAPSCYAGPGRTFSPRAPTMVVKEVLPNGLTLVTESMPHVRSVAVGVWLKQGSRHEREEESGISHYIEHMVFKGTKRRTAEMIASE